jgi:C1A family cysteine protease
MTYGMGLKSLRDPRYDEFERLVIDEKSLPPVMPAVLDYSESGFFPAIDSQGGLGCCTAYSARKQFEFYHAKRRGERELISARALFAAGRAKYEPGDTQDDGANCSDMLNILTQFYVNESDWPSVPNDSEADFPSYLEQAPTNLQKTDFLIQQFVTVNPTVEDMKKALYCRGILMIGTNWAQSWFNPDENGVLPVPDSVAGGHAISVVGYNDTIKCPDGSTGCVKIANNWSQSWGLNGYCYLPYSYATFQNGNYWPTDIFTIKA